MWRIILAAPLLAACQTVASAPSEPLPTNYRQMIVEKAKEAYFDPYSIRDASISQPLAGVSLAGAIQTVCVKANANNRFGAYTGIKASTFVFKGGVITAAMEDPGGYQCEGSSPARYTPFPELERS